MRKILGPILLAVLALSSLLYMQHQKNPAASEATAPAVSTTAPPAAPPPQTRPPATTSSTSTPDSSPLPPIAPRPADGEGTSIAPTAAATPAGTAQATQWTAAAELAVTFLKAYARPAPTTPASSWWAGVKPLMTSQAAADYEGTDPVNVPFTTVTGPPVVVPLEAPDTLATAVQVPTDAGPYLVEIRTTPDGLRVARAAPQGHR